MDPETKIVETSASQIIKEAALRAAVGAIVGVVVHQAASYALKRAVKKLNKDNVIETTGTEA